MYILDIGGGGGGAFNNYMEPMLLPKYLLPHINQHVKYGFS